MSLASARALACRPNSAASTKIGSWHLAFVAVNGLGGLIADNLIHDRYYD